MGIVQTTTTVGAGAVFGLALAAPPGPMNAVIAEESVVYGWYAGFKAGMGAMLADICFLVLSLAGAVAVVARYPTLRAAMVGVGGLLMLYFAYGATRKLSATLTPDGSVGESTGFRKALVLALTNPFQILFWLTIGVGLLNPGRIDILEQTPYVGGELAGLLVVRTGSPALLIGLFGGILLWIVGFPAALVSARDRVDAMTPVVAGVSAVILGGFGVVFLADAAGTLL
jgi:threonine/homoserine/homoserine lactone efflux protein